LSFFKLFVSIHTKDGAIIKATNIHRIVLTMFFPRNQRAALISRFGFLSATMIIALGGCVSTKPAPLAIRMYNPDTHQTLHCAARDQSGQFTTVLADAVEACARQLEAKGFVRD
jgi:hypothetical protein